MRIPAYQIYNVLRQYTDQLTGSGGDRNESGAGHADAVDGAGLFSGGKRREIIESITETIKETVSRVQENEAPSAAVQAGSAVQNEEFTPFVYNVIDKDHRKVKRTIAVTRFYVP